MVNEGSQLQRKGAESTEVNGNTASSSVPKNAVARQLKAKTFKKKGVKSRRKKKK